MLPHPRIDINNPVVGSTHSVKFQVGILVGAQGPIRICTSCFVGATNFWREFTAKKMLGQLQITAQI
jgi:hypothetical protein